MRPRVRRLFTSVIALAILLLVAQCSDEPTDPASAIHQSYEIAYDVARNRTIGKAALRTDNDEGAQIQVSALTSMLYNGVAMSWTNSEPFGYERILTGRVESGVFEFTDGSGTIRTNMANLSAIDTIAFPTNILELSVTTETEVTWQGAALADGETVSLIFTTPSSDYAAFYEQMPGRHSIILSAEDIAAMGTGTATWRLERSKYLPLQSATSAGGRMSVRWSTGDRPIIIR